MNDKLNEFVKNMGILCETWIITYNSFVQHGMAHKEAMEHTKGFMAAFMEGIGKNNGGAQ